MFLDCFNRNGQEMERRGLKEFKEKGTGAMNQSQRVRKLEVLSPTVQESETSRIGVSF